MHALVGHFRSPVVRADAKERLQGMKEELNKQQGKVKQAILLYASCMFDDMNERALDWLPTTHGRNVYINILSYVILSELPDIPGDDFEADGHHKAKYKSVHRQMVANIYPVSRHEPNSALDWWHAICVSKSCT